MATEFALALSLTTMKPTRLEKQYRKLDAEKAVEMTGNLDLPNQSLW